MQDQTSPDHHWGEPDELAAMFVTGAMPEATQRAFEAHLATGCERCQEELYRLEQVCEFLLDVCSHQVGEPDGALRDRILGVFLSRQNEEDTPSGSAGDAWPEAEAAGVQLWRNWEADDAQQTTVVHDAAATGWEPTAIAGIDIRRLSIDHSRDRTTCLVRMAPGTKYPGHRHSGPEECFVLQGTLCSGGDVLRAGDYKHMAVGSIDDDESTEDGCLLLIVSSLHDEFT